MKRTLKIATALTLLFALALCLISCNGQKDLWENATYTSDTELGEGEKVFTLEVTAAEKTVTFTVKTDGDTVGDALSELELIDGEEGQFGLYVKEVNGIIADFDADGCFWAFYVDGVSSMSGVDTTPITEGATYRLAHEK